MKFTETGLKTELLKALEELNFTEATPIQAEGIPFLLNSRQDLVGLAQTGTGKTAAFTLPLLERIKPEEKRVQVLVLCPTRELCLQITKDVQNFSKFLSGVKAAAIYGGKESRVQIQALREGAQFIVGTPGRVHDLIRRGHLKLSTLNTVVLDEADDMLDKGFKEDLEAILAESPSDRQTLLFSATMSDEIRQIARKHMKEAHEIRVSPKNQATVTVEHLYMMVHAKDRYLALRRFIDATPEIYGIVFCRTREETKEIAAHLIQDGYKAEAIHGDLTQEDRNRTMSRFRKGEIRLLIATDVAARGIDVKELTHVINYQLPDKAEIYVHRSGRTGRAGKTGIALTILHMKEKGRFRLIERLVGRQFKPIRVPGAEEIVEKKMNHLLAELKDTSVDQEMLAPLLAKASQAFENMETEEILQKFLAYEMQSLLRFYKNAPDLNVSHHEEPRRERRSFPKEGFQMARFRINLGHRQKFNPKQLFQFINSTPRLRGVEVGEIKIQNNVTFFDADRRYEQAFVEASRGLKFNRIPVKIERMERSHYEN